MKRFNMNAMAVLNTTVIVALGLSMLAGCGKKNKTSSGNVLGNPGSYYPPVQGQQGYGPTYSPQVAQIKGQVPCYGGQRLMNDANFTQMGGGSGATLSGPFQPGVVGGQVTGIYVGKSYWNDLIIISKVTNGGQLIGWNITLSMCSMNTQNGFPVISDQRPLTNLQAPKGITISENTGCGYGNVVSAQDTNMISAPFQGYPAFNVATSFTSVCGGNGGGGYGGGFYP